MHLSIALVAVGSFSLAASAVKTTHNDRCGVSFGTTCLGSSYGDCCSQYNYCGSTSAYCGTGCQSGFGNCDKPSSSRKATPSSTSTIRPLPTKPVSNNARCGAKFGGQTCQGSKWGDCCSQYFYCGSTVDYCGPQSCQAGYGLCDPVALTSSKLSSFVTRASSSSLSSSPSSSSKASSILSSSVTTSQPASSASSSSIASSSSAISSSVTSSTSSSQVASSIVSSSLISSSPSPTPSSASPSPSVASSTSSSVAPVVTCTKQIVINGGFETGAIAPWSVNKNYNVGSDNQAASGTSYLRVTIPNLEQDTAVISQTPLSIPAGSPVSCSFQWASYGNFEFESSAEIYVGGQLCGQQFSNPSGYQTVSGTTTTTVANPNVQVNLFYQVDTTGGFLVDNISVVATLYGADCPS